MKLIIRLAFCSLLISCSAIAQQKQTVNSNNNGPLNVILEKISDNDGKFCSMHISVSNNYRINFSDLIFEVLTKDAKGNIIATEFFHGRVTPNSSSVFQSICTECSSIRSMHFNIKNTTQINGKYVTQLGEGAEEELMMLPLKTSSKIRNISTTPR